MDAVDYRDILKLLIGAMLGTLCLCYAIYNMNNYKIISVLLYDQ
jgi:hypothetical protein